MSAKEFKQFLEQISSHTSTEPHWEAITNIVELVKQREISAKKASQEIRKKLLDANETSVLQTLYLLDSIVKNTPAAIHKDFLTSELLGALKAIVEGQGPSMAKAVDKALEMLGEWKAAFGDDPTYKIVQTTFNDLEKGGYFIPEATLASASYMQKPPAFQEADRCFLCSKEFGKSFIKGRHHCRNCGKSICGKCTGETNVPLPQFGIKEPQRVCITCHKKLDKSSDNSTSEGPSSTAATNPADYLQYFGGGGDRPGGSSPAPPTTQGGGESSTRERQLQEEEELQMAIAMSLNEEENKKKSTSSTPATTVTTTTTSAPPTQPTYTPIYADLDFATPTGPTTTITENKTIKKNTDDELQRYLNSGRQQKDQSVTQVTATAKDDSDIPLCNTLESLIDRFTQRAQGLSDNGTNIAVDQPVLTMYQDLTAMNIQLLKLIDDTQEKKVHMESLLQKLNEAKEARVTLDTMRRRHQEQLLQQEKEQAALAQMQVQMKLALLRQQKAEQLAYGQSMQAERLGRLSTQREEYERVLATQREMERNQLIAQEQHVYQQQFNTTPAQPPLQPPPDINPTPYNMPPPITVPPPSTVPMGTTTSGMDYSNSMSSFAGQLPQKVEPPPYQPAVPSLYQPSLYQPPPPSNDGLPGYQPGYGNVETQPTAQPSYVPPSNFGGGPVGTQIGNSPLPANTGFPPNGGNQVPPLMTGLSSAMTPPTSLLQRPPSEPPLISFD